MVEVICEDFNLAPDSDRHWIISTLPLYFNSQTKHEGV